MEEGRRWLQSRLRRDPEAQRRRRVVESACKEGNDEVLRELIGEVLPSDWADRELVPRCLSWLQDRKNSRRAAALRSLWQYVQFTCVEQIHHKAWAPSHLVHTPSFAAASNNVFNLAEAKDTVPLLLASLHQSLLRQSSSSSSSPHDKANKKRVSSSSSSSSDRVTVPLFETTKKKNKRQLKDKKVNIANDEDRLMSVLEEKLLALSLLAALSVAFSVETALDVVDTFLPVVAQLALTEASQDELAVDGKERKNQKKDEVQASALLRCAAVELHTELLYLQLLHLPSSFPHDHTIHPRNRKNGPLEQGERFRRATSRMVTWDQLYEEAVELIRLLLHDECCSVRRTAVSMLAFWISVFPTALVHSFFNDFFEELVELLEDQDLFVRTEAGQALATLLLLNLDEEDDDPNPKKAEEEEEEERETHYYQVGSFALLQVEERVKELCWQRDFKFDRKGNSLQFKTFKRLREVVIHCRQLEEEREEALRNDRSDKPNGLSISSLTQAALQLTSKKENGAEYEDKGDEEGEGEEKEEEEDTQQAEDVQLAEQRNLAEMFFGELRVPLTNMAYLRLQKHWYGMLALRHGDKVEWKVRSWRGIVQLQTLSRIIGPSFGHSITASVLIERAKRIAEESALVVSSTIEEFSYSPAMNKRVWAYPSKSGKNCKRYGRRGDLSSWKPEDELVSALQPSPSSYKVTSGMYKYSYPFNRTAGRRVTPLLDPQPNPNHDHHALASSSSSSFTATSPMGAADIEVKARKQRKYLRGHLINGPRSSTFV